MKSASMIGLAVASFTLAGMGCVGCTVDTPKSDNKVIKNIERGRFPHQLWGATLAKYNKAGFVDYEALSKDRADLDAYLNAISKTSPRNKPELFVDKDDQLAYWINAYNALIFQNVLRRLPGIKRVDESLLKFFMLDSFNLGGETFSLKGLEDEVVRAVYRDPRIHFALNCASFSCPRLPEEAFTGEKLDAQLDRETRKFVAEPRNVTIDEAGGKLILSKLFDPSWFQSDFTDFPTAQAVVEAGSAAEKVVAFINLYRAADAQIPAREGGWSLESRTYDWTLNSPAAAPLR
jgi:hypothetical protein